MKAPSMVMILTALFLSALHYSPRAFSSEKEGVLTLTIQIDVSTSMKPQFSKLAAVADIIHEAMEVSTCHTQVGVGPIGYAEYQEREDMVLWGNPIWITDQMDKGPERIRERIEKAMDFAEKAIPLNDDEDDEVRDISSPQEMIYSSFVKMIDYYNSDINRSRVVGSLILSDAAPGNEVWSSSEAVSEISKFLPDSPFVPAVVGVPLRTGMEGRFYGMSECGPDFRGTDWFGNPSIQDPQLTSINDFLSTMNGQPVINFCQPDYTVELRKFIYKVFQMGGCFPMV